LQRGTGTDRHSYEWEAARLAAAPGKCNCLCHTPRFPTPGPGG